MYFILGSAKVLSAHHGGYGWLAKSGSSSVQPEDAPGPGDHEAPNGEDSTAALGAGKGTDSEGLNSNASTAPLDGVNAVADPAAALGGSLITMKKNVQGTMLLTITSNTVFLWSTRPSVMISKCRRRNVSIAAEGTNVDVFWKPDATAFAVLTSSGNHIHIYDILLPGQSQPTPPRTASLPVLTGDDASLLRPGTPNTRASDAAQPKTGDQGIDARLFRYEFAGSHVSASSSDAASRGGVSRMPHGHVSGPGEGAGVPARYIRWRGSIDVSKAGGIACAFPLGDEIIVSTRSGPNQLLSYSWYGQPNESEPLSFTDLSALAFLRRTSMPVDENAAEPESRLEAVWPDKSSELFVWSVRRVHADGMTYFDTYFVQRRRRTAEKYTWNGILLATPFSRDSAEVVTAAAVNTRHLLVVLGTSFGRVMVFQVSDTGKNSSLSHWFGEGTGTEAGAAVPTRGAVRDIDFSMDGLCVACGFEPLSVSCSGSRGGGLAVWSAYGRWLAGTVGGPEDFESHFRKTDAGTSGSRDDPTPLEEDAAWMRGVQALFWGLGSYDLFLLPSSPTSASIHRHSSGSLANLDESVTDIFVVPLAKLPLSGCQNLATTQHMYLQTDDRLLIHATALNSSSRTQVGTAWDSHNAIDLDASSARSRDAPSPLLGLGVTYSTMDLAHTDVAQRGTLLQGGPESREARASRKSRGETALEFSLDPEMTQWFSVQIPPTYITSNWPVKYSAPSPSMDYIAIAGRRGFAIYVIRQNRWRLFGNEVQEASFTVRGGLLWWEPSEFAVPAASTTGAGSASANPKSTSLNTGAILIVPCHDLGTSENRLRFFQATSNLDLKTCLATVSFPRGVISMDLRDDTLMVYTADNIARVYSLEVGATKTSISAKLHHQFSLSTCVPFPATVQSVFWLPTTKTLFSYYTVGILQQQAVVVLNHGKLIVLLPSTASLAGLSRPSMSAASFGASFETSVPPTPTLAGEFPAFASAISVAPDITRANSPMLSSATRPFLQLADGVEFVYLTAANESLGKHLTSTLWAICGDRIKSWFNFGVSLGASEDVAAIVGGDLDRAALLQGLGGTLIPTLEFSLDFFPLTVAVPRGIVAGLSQHMSLRSSYDVASFKVQTETSLWLPKVLRYLLAGNLDDIAVQVAYYYSDLDYFGHSLEVLLHDVLDEEAALGLGDSEVALLPRVVRFLQQFPNFLEVTVQCARKTEYALWEYLFGIVGDAKELFERCLDAGLLRTATSYLIILQTLEPASVSSKYAMELLERAFESEDFELCKELVRFLSSITTSSGDGTPTDIGSLPSSALVQHLSDNLASLDSVDADEAGRDKAPRGPQLGSQDGITPAKSSASTRRTFSEEAEAQMFREYGSRTLPDGTDLFYIEVLVSKHARSLLATYRLRTLGRLAVSLRFPLISWAKKEKNRSAIIGDWDSAFAALHQQFGIPLPDDTSVMTSLAELPPLSGYRASIFPAEVMSPAVMTPVTPLEPIDYLMSKRLNTVAAIDTASISSLERSFANSAPPLSAGPVGPSLSFTDGGHVPLAVSRMGSVPVGHPTRRQSTFADLPRLKVRLPGSGAAVGLQASQLRTYREAISELKDLQDVMRLSGCLQWLLLISAVLVDAETIVDTFCDLRKTDAAVEKELLFKWTTTLENTDAHGYQDLVMVVRAELSRRA